MKRLFVLAVFLIFSNLLYAEVPHTMSFQGVLKDISGHPVNDSTYQITFTIYNDSLNRNQLWIENQTLTTAKGLFHIALGNVNPIPENAFTGLAYVGFSIRGQQELLPRMPLRSVPYSYQSKMSEYALNADKGDGFET